MRIPCSGWMGLLVLVVLCLSGGAMGVLMAPWPQSPSSVVIEVVRIRYNRISDVNFRVVNARCDSGGQFRSRTFDTESLSPYRYIGWEVPVLLQGQHDALERYLSTHTLDPAQCAELSFRLTGQFKRRLINMWLYRAQDYDGLYFEATHAVALGDPTPGCGQALETPI